MLSLIGNQGMKAPFHLEKEKPPAATAFETAIALEAATPTECITHYTLLHKAVCQKGRCLLWIPPQQNSGMHFIRCIPLFVVSNPFHGLRLVPCKRT
jgi:hypothetical protein